MINTEFSNKLRKGYGIFYNAWLYDDRIKTAFRLLCTLSSLSAKNGYCYASNAYLAKLYNCAPESISRRIKLLEENGYISIKYHKRGCEIISREIRINPIPDDFTIDENVGTIDKTVNRTVDENVKDINTSSINISNIYMCTECTDTKNNPSTPEKEEVKNTPSTTSKEPVTPSQPKKRTKKEFVKPTVEELQKYIDENSLKVDAVYFYKHYEIRSWTLGNGKKMQNWKQTLRTWDLNSERYGTGSKKTYGAGIHTISDQDNFDGEVNF